MMPFETVQGFFPERFHNSAIFAKYLLKEYLQLTVLDFLSTTVYVRKLAFIGGTNLRLIKGIDRFSEDIDFDCREMPQEEFYEMTDAIIAFLRRHGLNAEARDVGYERLQAFRRNIIFPGILHEMGLSGHREERFLLKIECKDQRYAYNVASVLVKGCGYIFPFPVPPDPVLCAMKLSALLARAKGRDFYDATFLLQQTPPDYGFLSQKCGIGDLSALKEAVVRLLERVDLATKRRDFEHLLFNKDNSGRILHFAEFMRTL